MPFYDNVRRQQMGAVPFQNYPVQPGYDLGLSQYLGKHMALKNSLLQQQIDAVQRPKTVIGSSGMTDTSSLDAKMRVAPPDVNTDRQWAGGGGTSVISPHPTPNINTSTVPSSPSWGVSSSNQTPLLYPLQQPDNQSIFPDYSTWSSSGSGDSEGYIKGGEVNKGIWGAVNDVTGGFPVGGSVPGQVNPSTGDDVQIKAKKGEYIIPLSVVLALGTKYFDNLIKKYGGDEERNEEGDSSMGMPMEATGRGQTAIPENPEMQPDIKGYYPGGSVYGEASIDEPQYSSQGVGQTLIDPLRRLGRGVSGLAGDIVSRLTPDVDPYSLRNIRSAPQTQTAIPPAQQPLMPPSVQQPTMQTAIQPTTTLPTTQPATMSTGVVPQMRESRPSDQFPGYRISWDKSGMPTLTNLGGSQGIAMDDYNPERGIRQKGLPTVSSAISDESARNINQQAAFESDARKAAWRAQQNQDNLMERQQSIVRSFYGSKDPQERDALVRLYAAVSGNLTGTGAYGTPPEGAGKLAYESAQTEAARQKMASEGLESKRRTSALPASFEDTLRLASMQHPPQPERGDNPQFRIDLELLKGLQSRKGKIAEFDPNADTSSIDVEMDKIRNRWEKPTYKQFKAAGVGAGKQGTEAEIMAAYKRQYGG